MERTGTAAWAKYCLDPGSVENLLLILGEPGGGKSLLTRILTARLISPTSICVRIPLREQNVEDEIEALVCRQLAKDGDASEPVPTFKWFAEEFRDTPILLLFDGYDEVMQATGGIYRNLLSKIQRFQERCRNQQRPVRIVVTSRETLIDKADIPKKTLVMKLLEFNETQKSQWIGIWNEHNHKALEEAGIQDFSLPEGNKDIEELSGQPLLLMMLAIYDADFETKANALKREDSREESLDRTRLYDELLRRFIRRELRKGPKGRECSYEEADAKEQGGMVNEEMKKLGIAALGMFVREKLSLKVGELEGDLAYMGAKMTDYGCQNKKMLKNAEAVFGSFFFIHDSRRKSDGQENEQGGEDEKEAAFEFLHKTFYEFLAADLILQYLIEIMDDLNERRSNSKRGEAYYLEPLERPDVLGNAYYAAINSACLCIEPEIIQMIAEWKDGKLNQCSQRGCSDFGGEMAQMLADLFDRHAAIIRTGVFAPFQDRKGGLAGGRDYHQSCTVYLMNLMILRILTGGECRIKSAEWDYISQFLKLNAPQPRKRAEEESPKKEPARKLEIAPCEEMVLRFMALFQLKRDGEDVVLTQKTRAGKLERENLQDARKDVFDFVQDGVTRKVYQLHDLDSTCREKQQYRRQLAEQGFDFGFELVVAQIHEELSASTPRSWDEILMSGVTCLAQGCRDESLVLDWLLCIRLLVKERKQRDAGLESELYLWEKLMKIIIQCYSHKKEIVFTFLEITRELAYEEIQLDERIVVTMLESWSCELPDMAVAFAETVAYHINATPLAYNINGIRGLSYRGEIVRYNRGLKKICLQYRNTPKVVAALLNLLCMTGGLEPADSALEDIQKNWDLYLSKFPIELPALLRVYLQLGEFDKVKSFIRHSLIEKQGSLDKLLDQAPESVNDFLDLAQTVGEEQRLIECIVYYEESHILNSMITARKKARYFPMITGVLPYILDKHFVISSPNLM